MKNHLPTYNKSEFSSYLQNRLKGWSDFEISKWIVDLIVLGVSYEDIKIVKSQNHLNEILSKSLRMSLRTYKKVCFVLDRGHKEFETILFCKEEHKRESLSIDLAYKIVKQFPNHKDQLDLIKGWREQKFFLRDILGHTKKEERQGIERKYKNTTPDGFEIEIIVKVNRTNGKEGELLAGCLNDSDIEPFFETWWEAEKKIFGGVLCEEI